MHTGKHRLEIRLPSELLAEINTQAKKRGFKSANAFVRAAIVSELRTGETALDRTEQKIAASVDRVAKELRSLQGAQQSLFSLVDALVRLFLTCVPEPAPEMLDQAKAKARLRYDRFLLTVAQGLKRGS